MLRFVWLAALLGLTLADHHGDHEIECCSIEDRNEMQTMWAEVWSSSFTGRRIQVAQAIFRDLFQRDPEAVNLFKNVNVDEFDSPEFKAHCVRIVNGLDTVIGLLEDPDTLRVQLDHLADQHHEREGIHKSHFDEISHSFDKVMPQVVSCFNAKAWDRCFSSIAQRIASKLEA